MLGPAAFAVFYFVLSRFENVVSPVSDYSLFGVVRFLIEASQCRCFLWCCMCLVLVSAGLAKFHLVLFGVGLCSASFVGFCVVLLFVPVSAVPRCVVFRLLWLGTGLSRFRCFVWFSVFAVGLRRVACVLFGWLLFLGCCLPVSAFCVVF